VIILVLNAPWQAITVFTAILAILIITSIAAMYAFTVLRTSIIVTIIIIHSAITANQIVFYAITRTSA